MLIITNNKINTISDIDSTKLKKNYSKNSDRIFFFTFLSALLDHFIAKLCNYAKSIRLGVPQTILIIFIPKYN